MLTKGERAKMRGKSLLSKLELRGLAWDPGLVDDLPSPIKKIKNKTINVGRLGQMGWHTPVIPAFKRSR